VRRSISWPKLGLGVIAMIPAAVTIVRFVRDDLGANPIEAAMNQLGLWTLVLLLASLACTPLQIVTGWKYPLRLRRMLGLEAFAYVTLHFLTYLVADQFFDWSEIGKDIVKRKFITVGFAAFVLMIPLAVTSTNKMVKRLGFKRWKRLHRLAYVAAVLGVIHFVWRVKADYTLPFVYGFVLTVLLAVRLVDRIRVGRVRRPLPAA